MINKYLLNKIRSEGYPIIIVSFFLSIGLFYFHYIAGFIALSFNIFSIWFFRDPNRVVPSLDGIVVSPADGIVVAIDNHPCPDFDLEEDKFTRIGIFLRVTDVHVNRAPISGNIEKIVYKEGSFDFAWKKEVFMTNERLSMKINGFIDCVVSQIAGFVARRIICDVNEKENLKIGQTYGMIKFGSRTEVYIPKSMKVCIKKGQTLVAGETIIAKQ
ncbi:phosphatidylserine decarboxylase [Candidatus Nesciobacter abundans]|uniref:Phosphatidylserine decarboxylase n=1 Tax=Candidatus Nesciobacter abundans TaxID=2601668 RepID=A0A5C0UJQ0_9PROT|nr:phosphatidylserine decarboxylase [Candidatus Nesciobacter abundans]QEK39034.1 phosphatidylserine decarboxylase [Candidatus Nesciobacter abundans]